MPTFEVYDKKRSVKTVRAEIILKDPLVEQEVPTLGRDFVDIRDEACIGIGPTSSRIAVIDYNGSLDQVFKGAEPARRSSQPTVGRIYGWTRRFDSKASTSTAAPVSYEHTYAHGARPDFGLHLWVGRAPSSRQGGRGRS